MKREEKANLRGINKQNQTAQSHEDDEEEKTKRRRRQREEQEDGSAVGAEMALIPIERGHVLLGEPIRKWRRLLIVYY